MPKESKSRLGGIALMFLCLIPMTACSQNVDRQSRHAESASKVRKEVVDRLKKERADLNATQAIEFHLILRSSKASESAATHGWAEGFLVETDKSPEAGLECNLTMNIVPNSPALEKAIVKVLSIARQTGGSYVGFFHLPPDVAKVHEKMLREESPAGPPTPGSKRP